MKLVRAVITISFALGIAVSAQAKNIVKDSAFKSVSGKHLNTVDNTGDDIEGIAEQVDGDRFGPSGKSVLLEAEGYDYASVFRDVEHKQFGTINAVSFWYIQDGDPGHNELGPYAILNVKIKAGPYKDGTLIVIGLGNMTPGQETSWTMHNETLWHYQVFDKKGNMVPGPGFNGMGVPLSDIQALYTGEIRSAGIAIGLFATTDVASAIVDDLVVNVP